MSFWDRDTDDWFRRWFGGSSRRIGLPGFGRDLEFKNMMKKQINL